MIDVPDNGRSTVLGKVRSCRSVDGLLALETGFLKKTTSELIVPLENHESESLLLGQSVQ